MAMLVVWAAVLFTYGVSVGNAMDPAGLGAVGGPSSVLQLDMAPNSVDDMYSDCKDKMYAVVGQYLQNERNKNSKFKAAWDESTARYDKKWSRAKPFLGRERIAAIYTYTFGPGDIYQDFNEAVRSQRSQYKTSFGFHAFHFYLTDAIQALKAHRGETGCLTGYRRTNQYFDHVPNTLVRLGSFASSSLGRYSNNVERFGDKTCFKVVTCMGVDVSMYSKFENEGEVLIPPYEAFKVVGTKKRSQHPDLPCEVEYQLKSTEKPVSNLDCDLFKK